MSCPQGGRCSGGGALINITQVWGEIPYPSPHGSTVFWGEWEAPSGGWEVNAAVRAHVAVWACRRQGGSKRAQNKVPGSRRTGMGSGKGELLGLRPE